MSKDRDYQNFSPNVSPSGMFVQNYAPIPIAQYDYSPPASTYSDPNSLFRQLQVRNPMPVNVKVEVVDRAQGVESGRLLDALSKAKEIRVLRRADFDDFGHTIYQVALNMQMWGPDLYMFPLRGGRQPGIQLRVINDISKDKTIVFNYTQNSNIARHPVIRQDIHRQLEEQIRDGDELRLAVLDTAEGGEGSLNLSKRLMEVHAQYFARMKWQVRFYLLHRRDRVPKGKHLIEGMSAGSISFAVLYCPVDDLIIEDWDAGIGLSAEGKDEQLELKPLRAPGMVAIRERDAVAVLQSEDVSTLISQTITDSINDSMLSDDTLEFVGNVQREREENS